MLFGKPKTVTEESQSQYAAVRLGLPADSTVGSFYEFLVVGSRKNDEEGPEKILQMLQVHRAKLLSVNSFPKPDASYDFVLSCTIDASGLDCQIDQLLIMFRKLRFVERAEKSKMNGKPLSTFLFPLLMAANQRSVVFDAQSILSFEVSLAGKGVDKKIVSDVLLELGRRQGVRVFKEYIQSKQVPPEKQRDYITDSIKGYLMGAGWGIYAEGYEQNFQTVHITDPPILENGDTPIVGGSYLRGLIAGFLESKAGGNSKVALIQERYTKEKKLLTMYFAKESVVLANEEYQKTQDQPIGIEEAVGAEPTSKFGSEEDVESEGASKAAFATPANSSITSSSTLESNLGNQEIVTKILMVASAGIPKLNLMNSVKLTLSKANEYIERLMKAGLLEAKKNPSSGLITYYTTEKGANFQRLQEKLQFMLKEE